MKTKTAAGRVWGLHLSLGILMGGLAVSSQETLAAAGSSLSRQVLFQNTTVTLPESIQGETLNDGQGLMLSWAPLSAGVSPLLLMSFQAKTNLPAAVAAQVHSIISMETLGNKALPAFQRVDLTTNEVALGPYSAMEIRATVLLRDFGNLTKAYWVFPAAGRVWQAMLPDGGRKEIAKARKVISGITLQANPEAGGPPGAEVKPRLEPPGR